MAYHKNRNHKKKFQHKKFIIAIIIVAVLALGAGLAVYFITTSKKTSTAPSADKRQLTPIERADEVASKAQALALSGKLQDAYKAYDEAVAKSSDKQEKSWLLVNKAVAAINAKKSREALQFARQAEAILPTYSTSQAIAQAAEAMGDKSLAIAQYKTTINRFKVEAKDSPFYEGDIAAFQKKIKDLSR